MTNMDTAPSQPVNDEQDTTAANDPITITAEGPFGSVSWTPGEHAQMHLKMLEEKGELEEFLSSVQGELSDFATTASVSLCIDKSSILSLIAAIFGTDAPMKPFAGDDMDSIFGDIANGRFPRS